MKKVTVKELKEWFDQFPDDCEVKFAIQQEAEQFQSFGVVEFETPDLNDTIGETWEFIDFRNNRFVKPDDSAFGKTFLFLGKKV